MFKNLLTSIKNVPILVTPLVTMVLIVISGLLAFISFNVFEIVVLLLFIFGFLTSVLEQTGR